MCQNSKPLYASTMVSNIQPEKLSEVWGRNVGNPQSSKEAAHALAHFKTSTGFEGKGKGGAWITSFLNQNFITSAHPIVSTRQPNVG